MRPIPSLRSSLVTGLLRVAAAAVIGLLISVGSAIESFHQRNRLDLSNYKMTFDESFDTLDVSSWGPRTRWIAHTPTT
jgi:hypothetical protein